MNTYPKVLGWSGWEDAPDGERLIVNGEIVARVQYWRTRETWWCHNKEFISRDFAKQYAEDQLNTPKEK